MAKHLNPILTLRQENSQTHSPNTSHTQTHPPHTQNPLLQINTTNKAYTHHNENIPSLEKSMLQTNQFTPHSPYHTPPHTPSETTSNYKNHQIDTSIRNQKNNINYLTIEDPTYRPLPLIPKPCLQTTSTNCHYSQNPNPTLQIYKTYNSHKIPSPHIPQTQTNPYSYIQTRPHTHRNLPFYKRTQTQMKQETPNKLSYAAPNIIPSTIIALNNHKNTRKQTLTSMKTQIDTPTMQPINTITNNFLHEHRRTWPQNPYKPNYDCTPQPPPTPDPCIHNLNSLQKHNTILYRENHHRLHIKPSSPHTARRSRPPQHIACKHHCKPHHPAHNPLPNIHIQATRQQKTAIPPVTSDTDSTPQSPHAAFIPSPHTFRHSIHNQLTNNITYSQSYQLHTSNYLTTKNYIYLPFILPFLTHNNQKHPSQPHLNKHLNTNSAKTYPAQNTHTPHTLRLILQIPYHTDAPVH